MLDASYQAFASICSIHNSMQHNAIYVEHMERNGSTFCRHEITVFSSRARGRQKRISFSTGLTIRCVVTRTHELHSTMGMLQALKCHRVWGLISFELGVLTQHDIDRSGLPIRISLSKTRGMLNFELKDFAIKWTCDEVCMAALGARLIVFDNRPIDGARSWIFTNFPQLGVCLFVCLCGV